MDKKSVSIPALQFPSGGGTIKGMGEVLKAGGQKGTCSLSLPLPISQGRGYAPNLNLVYNSGGGNSAFGVGFDLDLPFISRRLSKGVPKYELNDEFIDHNGEILVPERNNNGEIISQNKIFNTNKYKVSKFKPHVVTIFYRLEYWQGIDEINNDFWLMFLPDGSKQFFGKKGLDNFGTIESQGKILKWLLVESVSIDGQHIYYQYKRENIQDINLQNPVEISRSHNTQCYLKHIYYCNVWAEKDLYILSDIRKDISSREWLLEIILDYGEHTSTQATIPSYQEQQNWPSRKDPFSIYNSGFEIRTHRLCRNILMFHNFIELGPKPILVKQMVLEYDETHYITQLKSSHFIAYDQDQFTTLITPPLDCDFSNFSLSEASFIPYTALEGINVTGAYQIVDLYGEGIPGILYNDASSYLYKRPERLVNSSFPDAISYGEWESLPQLPTDGLKPQGQRALIDITGNTHLDWVISIPGQAGFFSLGADGRWQNFTPFLTFPTEFLSLSAQLVDINSNGYPDLTIIGPNSVRIYANSRQDGFNQPKEMSHSESDSLPLFNAAETELVVFADMLGSGSLHLIRIRYNKVECWPNLGHGKFGKSILFATLSFDMETFNPKQLYLADLDGSGAADLIYINHDRLLIFRNQAGNGLDKAEEILFPENLRYDFLSTVNFVDLLGNGCATIVLTCPHMSPSHWICNFNPRGKPYLLTQMNNNMGFHSNIIYRSSAQEWLDEKIIKKTICYLPFPVQLVSKQIIHDEINENNFTQCYSYQKGYYDFIEREYRGFGLIIKRDREQPQYDLDQDQLVLPPLETRTWYFMGAPFDELYYSKEHKDYNQNDLLIKPLLETLLVNSQDQKINILDYPNEWEQAKRALSANILREEIYSNDGSVIASNPYQVNEFRYQVRIIEEGVRAVILPMQIEQISWIYERNPVDPMCIHQVILVIDEYGMVRQSATIHYPRRSFIQTLEQYKDLEQYKLRIYEDFINIKHLDDQSNIIKLGNIYEHKKFASSFDETFISQDLLTFEKLHNLVNTREYLAGRDLIQCERYYYIKNNILLPLGSVTYEGLLGQVLKAEIGTENLNSYLTDYVMVNQQSQIMLDAKYVLLDEYYWIPSPISYYLPFEKFYQLEKQIDAWKGITTVDYDNYYIFPVKVVDAVGSTVKAAYNYHFLRSWQITDPNENIQEIGYNALGQPIVTTFYGYEGAIKVGFDKVENYQTDINTITEAIKNPTTAIKNMANAFFYDLWSWMGVFSSSECARATLISFPDLSKILQNLKMITPNGYIRRLYWNENNFNKLEEFIPRDKLLTILSQVEQSPPCVLSLMNNNYLNDYPNQIKCTISWSDGFGRILQIKEQVEEGLSYKLTSDNKLKIIDNKPVEEKINNRWLVSSTALYNNKALPIKIYQPYYIDSEKYIKNLNIQDYIFHDRIIYDGLGRVISKISASGYQTRIKYGVWFDIYEDENDCASAEVVK